MLDYLRLALGLIPLGIYLIVTGLLAVRRKPTLLTSGQEALLIGFALMGFALIGPIELFFPTGAYAALGEWTWPLLLTLYGLIVLLIALQRPPAWTFIGLDFDQLRDLLDRALAEGSIEHAWLGNQLEIPQWDLRAIVEPSWGFKDTSHLNPCGKQKNLLGWYQLERQVVTSKALSELSNSKPRRMPGVAGCLIGCGVACMIAGVMFIDWDMERLLRLIARVLQG
jgi:hypothetical protein